MNQNPLNQCNTKPVSRYNSAAILLHWLMAAGFFIMLSSGLIMAHLELPRSFQFSLYQWHKGGGVLLGLSLLLRLTIRGIAYLRNEIPKPLPSLSSLEKKGALWGHLGLYLFMLWMPLSGWIMVSASPMGLPTWVFGWFQWPHLGWVTNNSTIEVLSKQAHEYGALLFGLLILIHIAAVIKHQWLDKQALLARISIRKQELRLSIMTSMVICIGVGIGIVVGTPPLITPLSTAPKTDSAAQTEPQAIKRPTTTHQIHYEQSSIRFAGTHMDEPFSGQFEDWTAEINFFKDRLSESTITVLIKTTSAKTGQLDYDSTLPTADWFNTHQFPTATFTSNDITKIEGNRFSITGELTIKNITHTTQFDFILSQIPEERIKATAQLKLNRLAFDIGKDADPDADWVGAEISLQLELMTSAGKSEIKR